MQISMRLLAALAFLIAVPAGAQTQRHLNAYELQAQQEGEQAIREGRFPELQGLTNSTSDQLRAARICSSYHGDDNRICGEVAGIYAERARLELVARMQQEERGQTPGVTVQNPPEANNDFSRSVAQRLRRGTQEEADEAAAKLAKFNDAERAAYDECMQKPIRGMTPSSPMCVASAPEVAKVREQQAAEQKAREEREARERAQAAQAALAKQKLEACENENAARLKLRDNIAMMQIALASIPMLRQELKDEEDAAKISGVTNLKLRHDVGVALSQGQKSVDAVFAEYKAQGGSASSPENVEPIPDPCAALR